MKDQSYNKAIDEQLEAVLADLAGSSTETDPSATAVEPKRRRKAMNTCTKKYRNDSEHDCLNRADSIFADSGREDNFPRVSGIIDHKLALLAVAGAAVHADAEPCLDRIVHELEGTGVTKADIREAVKSGRFPGVRQDLAARVFEADCSDSDEQESSRTVCSNATLVTAGEKN